MPEPRYDHGVALLSDSRVLVAAGYSDVPAPQSLGSSAIFDPLTGAWAASGALSVAREGAPLVALADGGALIIGGEVPGEEHHIALQSAERYDPSNGSWRETPPMTIARTHAASVRLPDGRVLVIGGANGAPDGNRFLATAEIYDPVEDTWKPTRGELNVARDRHLAVVLRDGRALVVGGEASGGVDTLVTELYDPETDSFVVAGNTHDPRYDASAVVLSDGRVLVTGGWNPQGGQASPPMQVSTEIYDPARGMWESAAPLITGRRHHASFALATGEVVVAGGTTTQRDALTSTEIFDPARGTWREGPELPTGAFSRSWAPIPLPDGSVMLTGGLGVGEEPDSLRVLDAVQILRGGL